MICSKTSVIVTIYDTFDKMQMFYRSTIGVLVKVAKEELAQW